MKIVDLDYYAIYGKSWLNKISATYKLLFVLFVVICVVFISNYAILGGLYAFLLLIVLFSKVPRLKVLILSSYPLIFILFYIFSINNLSLNMVLLLLFKVFSASTVFALLVFTTSYVDIFKRLDRFLPSFLTSTLFLTYRSIFILWKTFENLNLAMYIRGRPQVSRPIYSLKRLSNSLGYLIIRAFEMSEQMYEGMKLRGYSDSLKYLRK